MKPKDEAKEKRIKKETLQLVAVDGIAGVKMSSVAKSAEISPSMIYTYFKNKEELLLSIFKDCTKSLIQNLVSKRKKEAPYKVLVFEDFKNVLMLKLSKSKEYDFFKSYLKSPYFKEEYHQLLMSEGGDNLIQLFLEGQQQMIVKDKVNIFVLMALFDGLSDKLVEFHQNKRLTLNQQVMEEAFGVFWDGIRQ